MNGLTDAWRMHVITFHKDVARASDKEANARIVPGGRLLHFDWTSSTMDCMLATKLDCIAISDF
jgi:hypothetical protein